MQFEQLKVVDSSFAKGGAKDLSRSLVNRFFFGAQLGFPSHLLQRYPSCKHFDKAVFCLVSEISQNPLTTFPLSELADKQQIRLVPNW